MEKQLVSTIADIDFDAGQVAHPSFFQMTLEANGFDDKFRMLLWRVDDEVPVIHGSLTLTALQVRDSCLFSLKLSDDEKTVELPAVQA